MGGSFEFEDFEPLRVAAADGNEWGLECSTIMVEVGKGSGEEGQRTEEVQNVLSEDLEYENRKDSCLEKFSEFLGFPTKGFENEIMELMRKLGARQQLVKKKGIVIVLK